jgi:hypothetical protein
MININPYIIYNAYIVLKTFNFGVKNSVSSLQFHMWILACCLST